MEDKIQNHETEFGPDTRIEPPALPATDVLSFFSENLIPLLREDSGEKAFVKNAEVILRELWRRTHRYRPSEDRERRGRRSAKVQALSAIAKGVRNKEHGRKGRPTQGDLERILEVHLPNLDEDTRRKYAKLYRLTHLPDIFLTEQDWIWLAKHDPDYTHQSFFILKAIRDTAKQRGSPDNTIEQKAIIAYIKLCSALERMGTAFSAPSYTEVFHFDPSDK